MAKMFVGLIIYPKPSQDTFVSSSASRFTLDYNRIVEYHAVPEAIFFLERERECVRQV